MNVLRQGNLCEKTPKLQKRKVVFTMVFCKKISTFTTVQSMNCMHLPLLRLLHCSSHSSCFFTHILPPSATVSLILFVTLCQNDLSKEFDGLSVTDTLNMNTADTKNRTTSFAGNIYSLQQRNHLQCTSCQNLASHGLNRQVRNFRILETKKCKTL